MFLSYDVCTLLARAAKDPFESPLVKSTSGIVEARVELDPS